MRWTGREEGKQLIEEWPKSGRSHKEFCAKHDINVSTPQYWPYARGNRSLGLLEKFLPIDVVASPAETRAAGSGVIEFLTRGSATLRVPAGTDIHYLAELLVALG